jgi:hypothetical protein
VVGAIGVEAGSEDVLEAGTNDEDDVGGSADVGDVADAMVVVDRRTRRGLKEED